MSDNQVTEFDESALDLSDFDIEEQGEGSCLLGKGSFASVYAVRCKRNNKKYALKVVG